MPALGRALAGRTLQNIPRRDFPSCYYASALPVCGDGEGEGEGAGEREGDGGRINSVKAPDRLDDWSGTSQIQNSSFLAN